MNEKNDIMILDSVERYIRGEMKPDERLYFENLRKTNPEIDQLVVEHTLFLQQINQFGERKNFRSVLQEVHTDLAEEGKINSDRLRGKAKVVYFMEALSPRSSHRRSYCGYCCYLDLRINLVYFSESG